jgi:hypothetical protein
MASGEKKDEVWKLSIRYNLSSFYLFRLIIKSISIYTLIKRVEKYTVCI